MTSQAASLAARTDQTELCRECLARFGGISCPTCGSPPTFDLSRPDERRQANDWLRHRHPEARPFLVDEPRPVLPVREMSIATVMLVGMGVIAGHWLAWALGAAGGSLLVARLVWTKHGARLTRKGTRSGKVLVGVVPPSLPGETTDRTERTGSVQCDAPLRAPLSGELCVAFRLVGRVGECLVDDAAAAPFTIVTRDGPRVSVLASASIVELPVNSTEASAGALERVQSFLAERGIDADSAPVELAEGVICEGDEVVVEGTLESVASGKGYRGTAASEFIVGRSDSPVLIKQP
jgi:hypothetical protein